MEISKPSEGTITEGLRVADQIGQLILFIGITLEENFQTQYGVSNVARVQLAIPLTGDDAGEVYTDSLIFGAVLVPRLVEFLPDRNIMLGRIEQGDAKPGQSAPYLLARPTEDEETSSNKWLVENISDDNGAYSVKF
jgi:hypothetical protein